MNLWHSSILRVIICLSITSFIFVCFFAVWHLKTNIEEPAQQALRLFLDSAYRLPPANNLCNLEADIEFRTIPTAQCEIRDECVKVSAAVR
uniref:Uncharacterized protein n=1 Tax=Ditylenchus dipsaci TaxID=166011 RepID=A0A915EBY0_9BILA